MTDALLVDGGYVYTADARHHRHETGSVLAVDGTIVAVGDQQAVAAKAHDLSREARQRLRTVDASDLMVLPGLVNAHWHAALGHALTASHATANLWGERPDPWDDAADEPGLMSGEGQVPRLTEFFAGRPGPPPPTPAEEAAAFAEYAVWTQLRSGVTTFGDAGSSGPPEALLAAARRLGIRGVVSVDGTDGRCADDGSGFVRTVAAADVLARIEEFLSSHAEGPKGDLRTMVASGYSISLSAELGKGIAELTRRYDTPFITHVGCFSSESDVAREAFGKPPIERLADMGLLNDRLIAVHCGFVTDAERAMLTASGAHVNYSPAKYATSGESAVTRGRVIADLIQSGRPPSLSTDGLVLPLGGMVEAMQAAWHLHNQMAADNTALRPSTALGMATLAGAAALRWDDEIGSIEVGKQADLTLIPLDDWRYLLRPRPLDGLLMLGSSNDVHTVIVAGEVVLSEGSSSRVDEVDLRRRYLDACRRKASRQWEMGPGDLGWLARRLPNEPT